MIRLYLALVAAFYLSMPSAQAAGLKYLHIPGGPDGPAIDAAMWSPCTKVPEDVQVGALKMQAVPNCPMAGERLPLVIISHGYGGWYFGHHDTAEALADSGFVVVAINHPQANYADMSHANGLSVLVERPVDIQRTIDFVLTNFLDVAKIDPQRIGFYGFSQGGYTGLVLAGADPDFGKLPPRCADPRAVGCPQSHQARPLQHAPLLKVLTRDSRIGAMVIADPLSIVFQTTDSVKNVRIPLQVWGSELGGGSGASPADVAALVRLLPEKPEFQVVPKAVHMSFLTMCPKIDTSSETCIDAPGFDRAAFHRTFNAEVVAFFRRKLGV